MQNVLNYAKLRFLGCDAFILSFLVGTATLALHVRRMLLQLNHRICSFDVLGGLEVAVEGCKCCKSGNLLCVLALCVQGKLSFAWIGLEVGGTAEKVGVPVSAKFLVRAAGNNRLFFSPARCGTIGLWDNQKKKKKRKKRVWGCSGGGGAVSDGTMFGWSTCRLGIGQ